MLTHNLEPSAFTIRSNMSQMVHERDSTQGTACWQSESTSLTEKLLCRQSLVLATGAGLRGGIASLACLRCKNHLQGLCLPTLCPLLTSNNRTWAPLSAPLGVRLGQAESGGIVLAAVNPSEGGVARQGVVLTCLLSFLVDSNKPSSS